MGEINANTTKSNVSSVSFNNSLHNANSKLLGMLPKLCLLKRIG